MSSKKKKNKRRRARICNPPTCERITLLARCERCRLSAQDVARALELQRRG